uniref:Uncharacterized protein n=1 Tax=Chromera velia CCMP2878 TaxID=1169474 RepID=A0A0G4HFN7_9ALVE|eukprot:Cvel_27138.t1-p1 / transcript=Cvel_27138.t1 / gene=Cvel_27138 / organism=Chromera_velia_CCMP2878 / gene_product=hypothetical protein / transcript_product=hypothetical protein / location=Cvel_scaffold3336:9836-11954(+) / protein_length=617 / sequence_SO=supercontig / SO=protein_coding / is_pseudo=false
MKRIKAGFQKVFGEEGSQQYEREPVPKGAFKGWLNFASLFTSRHTAGTEFTCGPLFIIHGANAIDAIVGLFIGNILATLSWRFITAPIAVKKRQTLYYTLEKVAGRRVLYFYNLLSAVTLAIIAGAMFAVSASAVGAILDLDMPGLNDWLPGSWQWVVVCVCVGAVTSFIAAFGYTIVSAFAMMVTPFIFAVIGYAAYNSLQQLGVEEERFGESFWELATEKVWTGKTIGGRTKFGMAHCIFFAWFADLILHIGMADLTVLRFAKSVNAGWTSAFGMFIGHWFTWLIAGLMYAVQIMKDPSNTRLSAGPMAQEVAGVAGLILVIFAGWSTANPLLYAAGLAVQNLLPTWKTFLVTLLVGAFATLAGIFPAFVGYLLNVLTFFGLVLSPIGIVILCDEWVLPRFGMITEYSEKTKRENWAATFTWLITNAIFVPLVLAQGQTKLPALKPFEVYFAPLPAMVVSGVIYFFLSRRMQSQYRDVEMGSEEDMAEKKALELSSSGVAMTHLGTGVHNIDGLDVTPAQGIDTSESDAEEGEDESPLPESGMSGTDTQGGDQEKSRLREETALEAAAAGAGVALEEEDAQVEREESEWDGVSVSSSVARDIQEGEEGAPRPVEV